MPRSQFPLKIQVSALKEEQVMLTETVTINTTIRPILS